MLKWMVIASVVASLAWQPQARAISGCPTQGGGCGLNGGWLGQNIAFHELDADFNKSVEVMVDDEPGTLQIVSFRPSKAGGPSAELIVDRDHLKARFNGKTIEGDNLIGWVITVRYKPRPRSEHKSRSEHNKPKHEALYFLTVRKLRTTSYWTTPVCASKDKACRDREKIPLYEFEWTSTLDKEAKLICSPAISNATNESIHGSAVILSGDRYDDESFAITPESGTRFNIACVGTALAKLHFHRHTAAANVPHETTIDQQQALLRLLTGDYCGIGKSMTVNGRQLEYTYHQRDFQPNAPPFSWDRNDALDGIWDRNGAICIVSPRMGQAADEIIRQCPVRRPAICDTKNVYPNWMRYGYAVALWNSSLP